MLEEFDFLTLQLQKQNRKLCEVRLWQYSLTEGVSKGDLKRTNALQKYKLTDKLI